jgi:hypothetical protein
MSDDKPSKLGAQLPTSEQLQAAIGPELQALARQALERQGDQPPSLDSILDPKEKEARAKDAPLQQKTVPLALPVVKEVFAAAQAKAQAAASSAPANVPGVAMPLPVAKPKKLAPMEISAREAQTIKIPRKRSSLPTVLLLLTGFVAAAAAVGAVWQAKKLGNATASTRPDTPAATTATATSTERAVKFSVPARPDETTQPADTTPPAEVKPPEPPPLQPVATAEPPPSPPSPTPASAHVEPPGKTEPAAKGHHTRVAPAGGAPATAAAPAAAEPKKTASEDKKPAAPAGPAPSVDAILQQQLKSAIP